MHKQSENKAGGIPRPSPSSHFLDPLLFFLFFFLLLPSSSHSTQFPHLYFSFHSFSFILLPSHGFPLVFFNFCMFLRARSIMIHPSIARLHAPINHHRHLHIAIFVLPSPTIPIHGSYTYRCIRHSFKLCSVPAILAKIYHSGVVPDILYFLIPFNSKYMDLKGLKTELILTFKALRVA